MYEGIGGHVTSWQAKDLENVSADIENAISVIEGKKKNDEIRTEIDKKIE